MSTLTLEEREAVASYAARASWPNGFQIYERGTAADGVFVVLSGCVALRSKVRSGRAFVPWVATPGETFGAEGLAPNGAYVTDARADDNPDTLFISSARMREFVREQPTHALAVIGQIMAERMILLDRLREVTTLSVEQRLVAAIQRLGSYDGYHDGGGRIELSNTRYRLLCELVGATRESVSLVMGKLVGEGLAEREGNTVFIKPSTRLFERLGAEDAPAAATAVTQGFEASLAS
jgi:CRP-like cAMP-binding protein